MIMLCLIFCQFICLLAHEETERRSHKCAHTFLYRGEMGIHKPTGKGKEAEMEETLHDWNEIELMQAGFRYKMEKKLNGKYQYLLIMEEELQNISTESMEWKRRVTPSETKLQRLEEDLKGADEGARRDEGKVQEIVTAGEWTEVREE